MTARKLHNAVSLHVKNEESKRIKLYTRSYIK